MNKDIFSKEHIEECRQHMLQFFECNRIIHEQSLKQLELLKFILKDFPNDKLWNAELEIVKERIEYTE